MEGWVVSPICCVTKIAFSRQREQERDSKWISNQFLILKPMPYIQFPLPRFTFQQKAAAPYDPRVYLASVIWECGRVICGGRDVLTGPKVLSNIPDVNRFLRGWKRGWGFWKVYLSFSEAFQFLGRSWMSSQGRGDSLGKKRGGQSSSGQWEWEPSRDSVPLPGSQLWGRSRGPGLSPRRGGIPGLIGFSRKSLAQQKDLSAPIYFISPAKHPFTSIY